MQFVLSDLVPFLGGGYRNVSGGLWWSAVLSVIVLGGKSAFVSPYTTRGVA